MKIEKRIEELEKKVGNGENVMNDLVIVENSVE